jgi:hypothetical protein
MTEENKKLIESLISIETDECVEWPKRKDEHGYGKLWHKSSHARSHRLSYALSNKLSLEDISGKDIHHICENKSCLNPKHLKLLGSRAEHNKEHGRFTDDEIKAIRLDRRYCSEISKEVGCDKATILSIKRKRIYTHVDPNGPTFCHPPHRHGKFSNDEIRLIRKDKRVNAVIAKQYGCSGYLISLIKNKKSYIHVPD